MEKTKRIWISRDVYEKLEQYAYQKGVSVDDLANQLLEKAIN